MWCEGYRGRVAEGDRAICPTNLYLSRAWFYPRPALASCAGYGVAQALAILSGVSVGVRWKASREGRLRIGCGLVRARRCTVLQNPRKFNDFKDSAHSHNP